MCTDGGADTKPMHIRGAPMDATSIEHQAEAPRRTPAKADESPRTDTFVHAPMEGAATTHEPKHLKELRWWEQHDCHLPMNQIEHQQQHVRQQSILIKAKDIATPVLVASKTGHRHEIFNQLYCRDKIKRHQCQRGGGK